MLNNWITCIKEKFQKKEISNLWEQIVKEISWEQFSKRFHNHIINLSLIICSYILGSVLIYPEITWMIFFKELFSILCVYGAIYCWFTEKFSENNFLRICLATTTCFAPVLFMNNSFSVAIVCLLFVIFAEYLSFSYMQGHRLFSRDTAVYLICEDKSDLAIAYNLLDQFKVLELILLSNTKHNNLRLSKIRNLNALRSHIKKTASIPFYPKPQMFIYCSADESKNSENFKALMEIASEYSISLLSSNHKELSPFSLNDLIDDSVVTDKSSLTTLFKNKNIWICYDGRRTVLDLICILSKIAAVNLTIICESTCLIQEVNQILSQINNFKNYRIKVVTLHFLTSTEARPDILFYNIPIRNELSDEDHLKEALVRNVIETDKIIKLAQEIKIPLTFVLSSTNSLNANNWTGATQRLAELLCQHADFQCRKTSARFKTIRIPENIADPYGFLGEITSSLLYSGNIHIQMTESDLANLYYPNDIISLLLKAIMLSYKSEKTAEVLTVLPKDKADPKKLIAEICNLYGFVPDRDIKVHYNKEPEILELENFQNLPEVMKKTSILNIYSTKFVTSSVGNYKDLWTIEQISKMTPREIISGVFQSISEKINPINR